MSLLQLQACSCQHLCEADEADAHGGASRHRHRHGGMAEQ